MTSNQLAYWRQEEEKRHNRATEQENVRHNVQTEDLKRIDQALEKENLTYKGQELKIKSADALNRLNELYAKYGTFAAESIPWDVRSEVLTNLGVENASESDLRATDSGSTGFNQFWGEFRTFWNNVTKGFGQLSKGIFSLF